LNLKNSFSLPQSKPKVRCESRRVKDKSGCGGGAQGVRRRLAEHQRSAVAAAAVAEHCRRPPLALPLPSPSAAVVCHRRCRHTGLVAATVAAVAVAAVAERRHRKPLWQRLAFVSLSFADGVKPAPSFYCDQPIAALCVVLRHPSSLPSPSFPASSSILAVPSSVAGINPQSRATTSNRLDAS